jgi:hypothetical protein
MCEIKPRSSRRYQCAGYISLELDTSGRRSSWSSRVGPNSRRLLLATDRSSRTVPHKRAPHQRALLRTVLDTRMQRSPRLPRQLSSQAYVACSSTARAIIGRGKGGTQVPGGGEGGKGVGAGVEIQARSGGREQCVRVPLGPCACACACVPLHGA